MNTFIQEYIQFFYKTNKELLLNKKSLDYIDFYNSRHNKLYFWYNDPLIFIKINRTYIKKINGARRYMNIYIKKFLKNIITANEARTLIIQYL